MHSLSLHPQAPASRPTLFAVSLIKQALMSMCSLGFYDQYWFYKHWHLLRQREPAAMRPWVRGWLLPFFYCFPLFRRLFLLGGATPREATHAAVFAGLGWNLCQWLPLLVDAAWPLAYMAPLCLLPAQAVANRVNRQDSPGYDRNARISHWNSLLIVCGGAYQIVVFHL